MLHTKGSVIFRVMTAACISALVLASCGNTDSSSNRNGRLNSALCFDTQDEKDAAIADAQKALDEATPPTLEEAEQANNGGRATLAFIGPQLWWMRAASGASTTTTTQPATTTSSTSSTVASSSTSTSSTVASSSTSTSSTVASSSTSTDSTDVATDSTDQSTDTSVPLVGDMVLQQLQDELAAVTNAPLCDSTESSDTTVDPESSITCTATVRSDGASIDCARPLYVVFSYRTNSGGYNGSPVQLTGNEQTTFGPIDDVRDIFLDIYSNKVSIFSQPVEPGIYDIEVPIASDTTVDKESSITCTATIRSDGASIDCARPLKVVFFYRINSGGDGNPQWLAGNEQTTFGPIDDVRDIHLDISSNGVSVFSQPVEPGIYDFDVPISEETSEPDSEFREPNFSGLLDLSVGENSLSFTIPDDYPLLDLYLNLTYECEAQDLEASLSYQGRYFAEPNLYETQDSDSGLPEGICSINIYIPSANYLPPGATYDLVITSDTDGQIAWSGSVVLEGDGASFSDDSMTMPYFSGFFDPTTGEDTVSFTIPNNYSYPSLSLEIWAPCENQSIEAATYLGGFFAANFVDPSAYSPLYSFGDGLCGVWLDVDELDVKFRGMTFETVIRTAKSTRIKWRGNVPLDGDGVTRDGDIDTPPSNLEEPKPVFALPVNEVINRDKSSNEPNPVIPAGVTEVVCESGCLSLLREAAGVSEGVVTIQIGGEVIEVQPEDRMAMIPVRPTAKEILVTVTPSDGGDVVVLSTEVVVNSPGTFPTNFVDGAKSVKKINQRDSGIPTYLIVVLVALALAIAIELVRRQKVRLPQ